ncbi:MAG: serine hydroxymethyltransferase, partial [Candidatus Nitrosocosmicus sp.]
GFKVLGEKRGFTESHQLAVNVSEYGDGGTIEKDLENCNIILNRQLLPGDIKEGRNYLHPSGIRIGVPEVTRLGMKENDMHEIATFIKKIVIDKQDHSKVLDSVKEFRKNFQKVQYAFDNETAAYEYIQLTNTNNTIA